MRNRQKINFLTPTFNFWISVERKKMTKITKVCNSHLNTCVYGKFSHFLFDFLFLKILSFFAQKTGILAKKRIFFLQNKKLIKKWEKIPSEYGFKWFWQIFGDFCQKVLFCFGFFFTLVQHFWAKKSIFGSFTKMQFLAKNLTI